MPVKEYKLLVPISMFFYCIVITSSIAGQKMLAVGDFILSSGSLIFPLSYLTTVLVTEIYGFRYAKQMIITGALCNVFAAIFLYSVVHLNSADFWQIRQLAFNPVIQTAAYILLTSTVAYLLSELINAHVLTKLSRLVNGRFFPLRAIASTACAAIVDTTAMLPIMLYNTPNNVMKIYFCLIGLRISYEVILLPLLWWLCEKLKRIEGLEDEQAQHKFSSVTLLQ
ncbi:queuosine precursor transporter [Spartinivicinus ruber]|uniref:queuosine precursor transporter n=1 Tax=Spartinivicinus ruber TaxID=2683272 RepID=UPI0013CFA366|nr:queuosine precursor transporter [Spartinivicinus ruber]